jgi:hypothetical protein
MALDRVILRFAQPGGSVALRELTGFDEHLVEDTGTAAAIRLLDALVVSIPGSQAGRGAAAELCASDRDRLLAAVYRRTYGDRIESTTQCRRCGSLFDLSFSLQELSASLEAQRNQEAAELLPDGTFRLRGGGRFRLPTGREECAVAELPPQEATRALRTSCVAEGEAELDPEALDGALAQVAPVLDLDLDARCPECGQSQTIHFDIQSYLLSALLKERRRFTTEVHRLAVAYGWSLHEILSLRRSERRAFVELVEAEMPRRPRGAP